MSAHDLISNMGTIWVWMMAFSLICLAFVVVEKILRSPTFWFLVPWIALWVGGAYLMGPAS